MSLLTKNISFAGKIGQNIVDDGFKRHTLQLISEKYGAHVLKKHYAVFDVEYVGRVPMVACLRSNGNPYYMFLTKYNGRNICIFIDKKIQTNYTLPRMICCFFQLHDSLFKDTILDGEMVKDKNDEWLFLINDMYAHEGVPSLQMRFTERLKCVHDILQEKFVPSSVDVCNFQVKRFVKLGMVQELLDMELPYTNRGLLFKALYSKFQDMQYNFEDVCVSVTKPQVKTREFVAKVNSKNKKLYVSRGTRVDNYVCVDGPVFVRTLANALKIRDMFSNQPVNKAVLVDAKWNDDFAMWELIVEDEEV